MHRLVALVLGAALMVTPLPLPGQSSDPELAQGVRQVREGDFESAVTTLESAVRRLSGMPERSRELVQAYLNLGVAYVALDQPETARGRFKEALIRDRKLKLSPAEYSPKVLAVFEEARREARRAGGGGKGGSRAPLIALGVGAAAAGVVLATRGGSDEPPTFSGARFASTVVVCPDDSVALPIPVIILVEAQAGTSSLTIEASATLKIVFSADPGEVGFGSNRMTRVTPSMLSQGTRATLQIETSLQCDNGPGDSGRFNEWSGQVTLTTSGGVFSVETVDRLRVNIP
jgi:tetratricopeptide (TPR) repeat protein